MTVVTVYSRTGCHLCHDAIELLETMKDELEFSIDVILIDGNPELEKLYGEKIPVTQIDGQHHDFWRIDSERFRSSLLKYRQHQ
ncbi:MAG: glutaredoxin family protein [Actinobacteria bacterium]|nr:glutaredoxin family protein [Actinomycetota bacterium]